MRNDLWMTDSATAKPSQCCSANQPWSIHKLMAQIHTLKMERSERTYLCRRRCKEILDLDCDLERVEEKIVADQSTHGTSIHGSAKWTDLKIVASQCTHRRSIHQLD